MKYLLALACLLFAVGGLLLWFWWPAEPLPAGVVADRVVVYKAQRRLELWQNQALLKCYPIALGGQPEGAKRCQGDQKTPEGRFVIDRRLGPDASCCHRSLHISYPRAEDVARAEQVCLGGDAGGDIMIHGMVSRLGWVGRWHRLLDWTRGCVALSNEEMDELWEAVPDGVEIEILP